jgi:hypothetical protein
MADSRTLPHPEMRGACNVAVDEDALWQPGCSTPLQAWLCLVAQNKARGGDGPLS